MTVYNKNKTNIRNLMKKFIFIIILTILLSLSGDTRQKDIHSYPIILRTNKEIFLQK